MSEPGERRFFGGDNLTQALLLAARHFQVDPEELAYRVLERRHGFLRARKKVMIEVDPAAPRRPAEASTSGPAPALAAPSPVATRPAAVLPGAPLATSQAQEVERRPVPVPAPAAPAASPAGALSTAAADSAAPWWDRPVAADAPVAATPSAGPALPAASGPEAESCREAAELLARLAGLEVEARVLQDDDALVVDLSGSDAEQVRADDGGLLRDLEHLSVRMMRGLGAPAVAVRFDSGGFRDDRAARLRELARSTAAAVGRDGQARTLAPMPPAERRVVHVSLADDPAVETLSEGDGYLKRVVVRPSAARFT